MNDIYLDYAATTPCDPQVIKVMAPYWAEQFGNASSPHFAGRRARHAVETAREQLAALIGAEPTAIVFTSGATEANNQAILGVARALKHKGRHIVVSAIEHHSVLEPAKRLKEDGYAISYVMPDAKGNISPDAVKALLRPDTILTAIGHANNEIGVVQDIAAIARVTKEAGVYLLVDAVQTVGHLPVDVKSLDCDFVSLSAHKFYGPQGVGALYARKGTACAPLLLGGDQERSRRASTQNVAGIVGLGQAALLAQVNMAKEAESQKAWRDQIINAVLSQLPGAQLNGDPLKRLPNNAHFSFARVNGEELVAALDLAGIATSIGSACTSGQLAPSHVLKAIGLTDELALGSLRVTLGRWTKSEDIAYFIEQLITKIKVLQKF